MKIQIITTALLIVSSIVHAQSLSSTDSIQLEKKIAKVAELEKIKAEKEKKALEASYTKQQLASFKKTQDSIDALNLAAGIERDKRMNKEAKEKAEAQAIIDKKIAQNNTEDSLANALLQIKQHNEFIETEKAKMATITKKEEVVAKKEIGTTKTTEPIYTTATTNATAEPTAKDLELRKQQEENFKNPKQQKVDKVLENMLRHANANEMDQKEFTPANIAAKKTILHNAYKAIAFNNLLIANDLSYVIEFIDQNNLTINRNNERITTGYNMPSIYMKIMPTKFNDNDPQAYDCEITRALDNIKFINILPGNQIQLLDNSYVEILKLQQQ